MKHILILILCFFPFVFSYSQDMIYKKNGTTISAKIIQITPNEIKYQNPDSVVKSITSITILQVYMIRFSSGVEEIYGTGKRRRPETFLTDHKDNYYFSIATGIGPSYGFLGVRYQGRIGGRQGLGYHAGIGVFPGHDHDQPSRVCYSAGLKYYFYKAWYVDFQVGRTVFPNSNDYTEMPKDTINSKTYHRIDGDPAIGLSILAGGDWFFNKNFGMNGAFGVAVNVSDTKIDPMIAAVEFGVVYKFGNGNTGK